MIAGINRRHDCVQQVQQAEEDANGDCRVLEPAVIRNSFMQRDGDADEY